MEVLPEVEWRALADAHTRTVDEWVAPHLARRRTGAKHPVLDFLFSYYSFRPGQLRRWHPGAGVVLAGATGYGAGYRDTPVGATVDVAGLLARRGESVAWIRDLLAATAGRPAHLGCFGLHEWAMVYRQTQHEVRHNAWPLRLSPERTAAVVDERGVRCSHFDAFRFFTAPARPLNVLQPARETQRDHEQPGCLHVTMDLYKWAYKLAPLTPSALVLDCFRLASDVRLVDMRASPYDLTALGHRPIAVETVEGRAEYVAEQRAFVARGEDLRSRLLALLDDRVTPVAEHSAVEGQRQSVSAGAPARPSP